MKLSISNIAWLDKENIEVYNLMNKYSFFGLEVAPSRIIDSDSSEEISVNKFVKEIKKFDLQVSSMQSLHFGANDCHLFKSDEQRKNLLSLTKTRISLAKKLSCARVVFGSPKNRDYDKLSTQEVMNISTHFFKEIGDFALIHDVKVCLEANPKVYGTNFLNETLGTNDFVNEMDHPAIKLNFDMGAIYINKADHLKVLDTCYRNIDHVHISVPMLEHVTNKSLMEKLGPVLEYLLQKKYENWVSIEMKPLSNENCIPYVEKSLNDVSLILKSL